jgi:glycosyltransferase involved in cell wall biosynthesis
MRLDEISLILPTRDEQNNIGAFLDSLPRELHLIVVDASSDGTPDLIEHLRPDNTLVLREPSTVTEARQIGSSAARTDWLLYSDADIVFPDGYFSRLQGLDACDVYYGPKLSTERFRRYYRVIASGQRLSDRLGIPAASGSNLLVRRSAFLAAGGFDLQLNCNEDSELVWRMKRGRHRVRFCPELVVHATDHRRLERGRMRKTLHSLARCSLLYTGLLPRRWRGHDWGYWTGRDCGEP